MLIEFLVDNFRSFKEEQSFSMVAASSIKESKEDRNTVPINKLGLTSILKSAALLGANGSGKTNFAQSLSIFKGIMLESLKEANGGIIRNVYPFLIQKDPFGKPTEFEVSFLHKEHLYRYGLAIQKGVIVEEWLFWKKTSRETMLFHRKRQTVEYNKRSFSELKDFVHKKEEKTFLEKTREDVPLISVLAQFNGEKSSNVFSWFKDLAILPGLQEDFFKDYTINLFEKNADFKRWALSILSSFEIQDLEVTEKDSRPPRGLEQDEDFKNVIDQLEDLLRKRNVKEKYFQSVKIDEELGERYVLPFGFESLGTQKLTYLLGPLYDLISRGGVVVIDEFDSKFHTLLSRFLIDKFHSDSSDQSQLIITCHDTNLISSDIFRRDQIWFVDKSIDHASKLYSLVEYKEHYTRKEHSYSKDYLSGAYGAVPLFSSLNQLEDALDV